MNKFRALSLVTIVFVAMGFLVGCSTKSGPTLSKAQRESVSNAAEAFVEQQLTLVRKSKIKYGSDLSKIKAEVTLGASPFTDANGEAAYLNLAWVPKSKPSSSSCVVESMGTGSEKYWYVYCSVLFDGTGSCDLSVDLPKKTSLLPSKLEDFEGNSISCEAYPQSGQGYLGDFIFKEKPTKVTTNPVRLANALMTFGNCTGLPIRAKRLINDGGGRFHIVTNHVSDDPSAQGSSYDALTVVVQPGLDHYQLRQDGFGWESYFRCPMFDDNYGKYISATGADLRPYL
jgi:hypothetical protein